MRQQSLEKLLIVWANYFLIRTRRWVFASSFFSFSSLVPLVAETKGDWSKNGKKDNNNYNNNNSGNSRSNKKEDGESYWKLGLICSYSISWLTRLLSKNEQVGLIRRRIYSKSRIGNATSRTTTTTTTCLYNEEQLVPIKSRHPLLRHLHSNPLPWEEWYWTGADVIKLFSE